MQTIKTVELVKQYKTLTAVDKLNLEIQQGELFSLLGVNGAGKTTTIKMLTCLTKPSSGDAFVGGYSITKQSEQVKQLIGVSPQETAVAPNLSVEENLELICGIHGFSKKQREELRSFPSNLLWMLFYREKPANYLVVYNAELALQWHSLANLKFYFWMNLLLDWMLLQDMIFGKQFAL